MIQNSEKLGNGALESKVGVKDSQLKQLLCAFVINLVSLLQGASVSTSSIILHELQNSSSHNTDHHCHTNCTDNPPDIGWFIIFQDFHITQEEGSWVASSWVLGHLLSAIFAGFVSDSIGRKKSLLLDVSVFFVGFTILATSHLTSMVLARMLLGYPLVSQVFLCEILDPERRGLGAAMYSVLHSVGFFLVLVLGAYIPWRLAVAIPAILTIPTFVGICFLHESPEWLHKNGCKKKCQESLKFYQKEIAVEECVDIHIIEISKQDEKKHAALILAGNINDISKSIFSKGINFWKKVLYLSLLFCGIGWCGFSILSFYAVEVFQESGSPFSPSTTSWVTSLTKIVCSSLAFYVLHKFDRKKLFIATACLVLVAFLAMALFTFISKMFNMPVELTCIPMICVILAYTGYGLGYGVIPSLVAAEMMPVDVRSTMVGFFMTLEMTFTFFLSKMKPSLMESLGFDGLFSMFAGTVLVVILLTITMMPK